VKTMIASARYQRELASSERTPARWHVSLPSPAFAFLRLPAGEAES
jgi:hypothetical protein